MKNLITGIAIGAVVATAIAAAAQAVDRNKLATARAAAAPLAVKLQSDIATSEEKDQLLLNLSIIVLGDQAP